jgi:hypothetical protein
MAGRVTIYAKGQAGNNQTFFAGAFERLSPENFTKVAAQVWDEWNRLVQSQVPAEDQEQYRLGMQYPVVRGDGGFEMGLSSFDAVKTELGWRPPDGRGRHMSDGLDEYDGASHDMRSFMLTGATKTTKAGESYRVVKFDEAKSFNEIVAEATDGASEDAAAYFTDGARSLKARRSLRSKYSAGLPKIEQVLPPGASGEEVLRQHVNNKYHHVRKNFAGKTQLPDGYKGPQQAKFSVFRTIVDSISQNQKKLWWTSGTKPARLLDKMRPIVQRILGDMVAGNK